MVSPEGMRKSKAVLIYLPALIILLNTYGVSRSEIKLKYKPPILPVFISVDSAGNLSVGGEKSITTFIGTFTLGADYSIYLQEKYTTVVIRNLLKKNEQAYKVYTGGDELTVLADGKTRVEIKDRWVLVQVEGSTLINFKMAEKPSPKVDPTPHEMPQDKSTAYIEFNSFWPKKRGEIDYKTSYAGFDWGHTDPPHWRITHVDGYIDFLFKGKKRFVYYALGSTIEHVSYCKVVIYVNGRTIATKHIDREWKEHSIPSEEFMESQNTVRIKLIGDTHLWIQKAWLSANE
jgi:hypothetical protein